MDLNKMDLNGFSKDQSVRSPILLSKLVLVLKQSHNFRLAFWDLIVDRSPESKDRKIIRRRQHYIFGKMNARPVKAFKELSSND